MNIATTTNGFSEKTVGFLTILCGTEEKLSDDP